MGPRKDITGNRYHSLEIVGYAGMLKRGKAYWYCICDCGNVTMVDQCHLFSGHTKSCGCLQSVNHIKAITTHGLSKTRAYRILYGIIRRCYCSKHKAYPRYGGRGIAICDEWRNGPEIFCRWAFENGYKDNLTIDRIDNDGDYCPENCRWITYKEQANHRRNNHLVTCKGETRTLAEWETAAGILPKKIGERLRRGWSEEEAIYTPAGQKRKWRE